MKTVDVTISIVSYNTKDLLIRCLDSIKKHTKEITYEIIVVENGSRDGTVEALKERKDVLFINNKKNKFFTKANNQAFLLSKGRYFLILNADTYITDNSFKKMVDYLDQHKDVAACEGLEVYEDGRVVPTGSRFSSPLIDFYELSIIGNKMKNKKAIKSYRMTDKKRTATFDVDVACDAFLMVRRQVFKDIGMYDERMKLYYTENDLCKSIKKMGQRIVHLGNAKVIHKVSASADQLGVKKNDIYYNDLLSYYKKHNFVILGYILYFDLLIEKKLLKAREFVRQLRK